ncbi:hypothetical protein [Actinopolymorpha rutila]|uniref:Uncharacterized protein n=1 Tax=Actinopolymorpha rutila TaxID=446787 RepID=A0A852ZJL3_9ACTN|nr:hypothetical protein [Actinopolymorpha rutila]NYH92433.1 hypothetical protein [Actinopolymorpha rutila]
MEDAERAGVIHTGQVDVARDLRAERHQVLGGGSEGRSGATPSQQVQHSAGTTICI